jgi:hypothetical protein
MVCGWHFSFVTFRLLSLIQAQNFSYEPFPLKHLMDGTNGTVAVRKG